MSEIWVDDKLERRVEADVLYKFLLNSYNSQSSIDAPGAYVLNIDADWGSGKSFFLERLASDIRSKGHTTAFINAWRDDFSDDPYIAIMAALDEAIRNSTGYNTHTMQSTWSKVKKSAAPIAVKVGTEVLKSVVKKASGVALGELASEIGIIFNEQENYADAVTASGLGSLNNEIEKLVDKGFDDALRSFNLEKNSIDKLKCGLTAFIRDNESFRAPLFILVDELDRCRPDYAVKFLERVKHIFDTRGVIFIFATNIDQLQHTVCSLYGDKFNGNNYLYKFFDRTYTLQRNDTAIYIDDICKHIPINKLRAPNNQVVNALKSGCDAFGLNLRAIKRVLKLVEDTTLMWPHQTPIEIVLLFPLCVHYFRTRKAEWPGTNMEGLSNWIIANPVFAEKGRKDSDPVNMEQAYVKALNISRGLHEEIRTVSPRDDATSEYAQGAFLVEWNGLNAGIGKVSIQQQLISILAYTAKLVDE